MGELFRRTRPPQPLDWTGERLVTELTGSIESEHLHRYFTARELCRGKDVLDVASGEGYGTALLSQTAKDVVGVELDHQSVKHAAASYCNSNLRYLQGDAICLPVETGSVDVVVSFETLEHLADQDRFLSEVSRVLRPDGLFMVSTPDSDVYSGPGTTPNPYHVHELTAHEFSGLLANAFGNVRLYRQRFFMGSALWPERNSCLTPSHVFDQRGEDTFESHRTLPRAPYLIALASNASLPCLTTSLYIQQDKLPQDVQAEIKRLQDVEAAYRQNDPVIWHQLEAAAKTQEESHRLVARVSEVQAELVRVQSASEQEAEARRASEKETEAQRAQLASATTVNRQQALVLQRLQNELAAQQNELAAQMVKVQKLELDCEALRATSAQYQKLSSELAGLLVPVWVRRLVPTALRPFARRLKRTF